jgi:hypothetical protein
MDEKEIDKKEENALAYVQKRKTNSKKLLITLILGTISTITLLLYFNSIPFRRIEKNNVLNNPETDVSKEKTFADFEYEGKNYYTNTETNFDKGKILVASTKSTKGCNPFAGEFCYTFYKEGSQIKNLGEVTSFSRLEKTENEIIIFTKFFEGTRGWVKIYTISTNNKVLENPIDYGIEFMSYSDISDGTVLELRDICATGETEAEISIGGTHKITKNHKVFYLVECRRDKIILVSDDDIKIVKYLEKPYSFQKDDLLLNMEIAIENNFLDPANHYFYIGNQFVIIKSNLIDIETAVSL